MPGSTHSQFARRSLFGQTRSALLALLYGRVDQTFYMRQLVREVGAGHGAVQRELKHLENLGLIVRATLGNQVLYRANSRSPIFSEIKSLIAKTVGINRVISSALASLGPQIEVAFVYGSVARQEEAANSDVDLMVLGNASFSEVVSALGPAQKALGREINPTVFPLSEFRSKLAAGNHFLQSVMKEKRLVVVGTEHELAELASKRLAGPARNKR
ncbi:MAG: nucleotidyltransferase domain-containing protein [Terriglobales bacterium]|jgi:predicted nucleotidyltransferase